MAYKKIKDVDGVFIDGNNLIITGTPDCDDEEHNCDEMMCNSVEHILLRCHISMMQKGYDPAIQEENCQIGG